MNIPKICAIAAMDERRVIGLNNKLPWHIPTDMQYFKELTEGHAVLMGRKTYESLPERFRPLPKRKNIVLSRNWLVSPHPEVSLVNDLTSFIEQLKLGVNKFETEKLWIIGGQQVYYESLPFWDMLYLTRVHSSHEGDAFFPVFEDRFKCIEKTKTDSCTFEVYSRII